MKIVCGAEQRPLVEGGHVADESGHGVVQRSAAGFQPAAVDQGDRVLGPEDDIHAMLAAGQGGNGPHGRLRRPRPRGRRRPATSASFGSARWIIEPHHGRGGQQIAAPQPAGFGLAQDGQQAVHAPRVGEASFTRQTFLASRAGTSENRGSVGTLPAIHMATSPCGLAAR